MPPKKAAGAAAPAKEAKEKKPAAAPAHASYKGQFASLDTIAASRNQVYRCRVSMLTLYPRHDQGGHSQRKSILFATTSMPPSLPILSPVLVAGWAKEIGICQHNLDCFAWILTCLAVQLKERNGSRLVKQLTDLVAAVEQGRILQ